MTGQTDLALCLKKDKCANREFVYVSNKEASVDLYLFCPNGRQESASMAPQCKVVQFMPHPACDCGVSLSLGDEVTQQGVGAKKVQADVCGLCKVSQHW